MRTRALVLWNDAIEFGGVTESELSATGGSGELLRDRLRTLCEKDEAKDVLHGALLARMERRKAECAWLNELDERPAGGGAEPSEW